MPLEIYELIVKLQLLNLVKLSPSRRKEAQRRFKAAAQPLMDHTQGVIWVGSRLNRALRAIEEGKHVLYQSALEQIASSFQHGWTY